MKLSNPAPLRATCHVYIKDDFTQQAGPRTVGNEEMLDFTASNFRPSSRLPCQITVTPDLNGIRLQIPEEQF